jgi:hypothetical protein
LVSNCPMGNIFAGVGRGPCPLGNISTGAASNQRGEWLNGLRRRLPHSESTANLLVDKRSNFAIFSECALISKGKYSDFDSAIPRFESWRPSQDFNDLTAPFPKPLLSCRHLVGTVELAVASGELGVFLLNASNSRSLNAGNLRR